MSSSQISSSNSEPRRESGDRLAAMLDIPCSVDVLLGTGSLTLRECIQLERHSVVRLGQAAGSDLSVVVHGIAIATGEVVIVDDNTALRVSHVTPMPGAEAP